MSWSTQLHTYTINYQTIATPGMRKMSFVVRKGVCFTSIAHTWNNVVWEGMGNTGVTRNDVELLMFNNKKGWRYWGQKEN